jgi:hypothetical protein
MNMHLPVVQTAADRRRGIRRVIGIGASITVIGIGAAPAVAGGNPGKIVMSGPSKGTYLLASCSKGSIPGIGRDVTITYGTQISLQVLGYRKHGAAKANLAKSNDYLVTVKPSFYLHYAAGADKSVSGSYSHLGSGSLSISSNLESGSLTAHLINLYKPHAAKLTVKASWHCPAT